MTSGLRHTVSIGAVFALSLLVSCACNGVPEGATRSLTAENGDLSGAGQRETRRISIESKVRISDTGDFVVRYAGEKRAKYKKIENSLRRSRIFERVAEKLNRSLKLPGDIALRIRACREINAFYDPNERSITFCYGLMEHFFRLYELDGDSEGRALDRMNSAVTFVVLHEVAHALIDIYDLPITGNEEAAADRCSSIICIEELGQEGIGTMVAAAEAFAIESAFRRPAGKNFTQEHLLSEQRFQNSLCMLYGSNPDRYVSLKRESLLPETRAARCPKEYARTAKVWESLLRPWKKD